MAWEQLVPLTGDTGAAGAAGNTVRNGTGAPGAGLGVDGDYYIRTDDWTIYGPKTSGSWGSPTSLVGPPGANGVTTIAGASDYASLSDPAAGTAGLRTLGPGAQQAAAGNHPGLSWAGQVETLADAASISPDAQNGLIKCGVCTSLNQDTTLSAPVNGSQGQTYRAIIKANAATRVVTLSGWIGSTDDATTALSVPSGKYVSILGEFISAVGWLYGGAKLQS